MMFNHNIVREDNMLVSVFMVDLFFLTRSIVRSEMILNLLILGNSLIDHSVKGTEISALGWLDGVGTEQLSVHFYLEHCVFNGVLIFKTHLNCLLHNILQVDWKSGSSGHLNLDEVLDE